MKLTLLVSGGLDSTVLLHYALRSVVASDITAVTVSYGQPNEKEIEFAIKSCFNIGVNHQVISAYPWNKAINPVRVNDIPWSPKEADPMIIRGRNSLFVCLAYIATECDEIWLGANSDDQRDYRDCREDWANDISKVFGVRVHLPLRLWNKRDIVSMAGGFGIDLETTLSCYRGEVPGCGECNACILRNEAMVSP